MSNSANNHIADKIKALRQMHRLSQTEFARRIGTTKPVIGMIESNYVRCDDELLGHICMVFDISRNWFETSE